MRPGSIVAERFEVVRRAGRGGMATIYRAIDRRTGGPVALKLLLGDDPVDTARFADEARLLADLRWPGIVEYVHHGHTDDGRMYLVMEWLDGEDVAAYLKHSRPTIDEAVHVVRAAADALSGPHARGLVHRDIKPGNLFLVDGKLDRVRVLDFGVALLQDSGALATPAGTIVGTPAYMAPEQARAKAVDMRADVFSLGCVLFRMVARRPPFVGDSAMAIMLKVVLQDSPRLSELADVPLDLDELVARMLDKDPDCRPANASALRDAIDALGTPRGLEHAAARSRRQALTGVEQRLLSAIVVGRRRPRSRRAETESDSRALGLDIVARRFAGKLEELADGSAVVTLEGRGTASDQAAHAARCALALRRQVSDAPIALATGRGQIGATRPVGEAIDRAASLLELDRGPGELPSTEGIRLDQVTAGLLDIRFDVRGSGVALQLLGERQARGATRTLLGRPTPCVGRVRELQLLRGVFGECVVESEARCVLVTADPGVGKSRLRDELVRQVRTRHDDAAVFISHGDPMRAGSAFGMIARALGDAADVLDGEPLSVRQQKLRKRVADHVRGVDLHRVTGFIGELAGVPYPDDDNELLRNARRDPIVMGDQIQRAWIDLLAAETAVHPVLLVLEDLHWCDRSSMRLVDTALAAMSERPFMVFAVARPEVRELFPQLWHGRSLTQIELSHLSRAASRTLVREVLGDVVDDELVEDVVARAAGNAFYLEELIRSVAEGQRTPLPETVLAMVQARLGGLDAEARHILRAASVFGRVFWRGGVEVLIGDSESHPRVGSWLTELAAREVLTARPASALPGEREYIFRHSLLRDAAYRTLTPEDRALGHRIAGEWLERIGESDAMVLAEHFERGLEPARALRCYRQAAEAALEGNDFEETLLRAERAVERGASGEELGALRLLQAEAHRWLGSHPQTLECALDAMGLLPRGSIAWLAAAGLAAIAAGNVGDADRLSEVSASLYRQEPQPHIAGRYAVALARVVDRLLGAGKYREADRLLSRIENVHAGVAGRDPLVQGWVERVRGFRALFASDPAGFLVNAEASTHSFERAGDLRYACMQRGNTGYGYMQIGAYDDAARVLEHALATAERLGLSNVVTSVRVDLGLTTAMRHRAGEACEMLQSAIRVCVRAGNSRLEGPARIYYSTALDLRDDLRAAEREARLAVNVLAINPPARATALATLAHVLLRRDRAAEALDVATEASAVLDEFGGISEGESLVRLVYAQALDANGQHASSRAAIRDAHSRLIERAGRIENAQWRAQFLARVPANAKTIELAAAWTS